MYMLRHLIEAAVTMHMMLHRNSHFHSQKLPWTTCTINIRHSHQQVRQFARNASLLLAWPKRPNNAHYQSKLNLSAETKVNHSTKKNDNFSTFSKLPMTAKPANHPITYPFSTKSPHTLPASPISTTTHNYPDLKKAESYHCYVLSLNSSPTLPCYRT